MSGALQAVLGNAQPKEALQKALQNGSLPHAVLLSGVEGCGRNFFARCLAADYLYPEGGEGAAAVLRGESPEVLLVEGEGASGQIKIERVRQVRSDMFKTGLSAAGRVVLVRDAEKMAAPAANALLKVLEEPPGEVLFVLSARDAVALPATIRSRCAVYPLAELSQKECEESLWAEGVCKQEAQLLTAVYGGRLGLCKRAANQPDKRAVLQHALQAAMAAGGGDTYELLCIFSQYEGRTDEEKERRVTFLLDFARVLAAVLRAGLSATQAGVQPVQAAQMLPLVQAALRQLQGNAAPKLLFTALAVNITKEPI